MTLFKQQPGLDAAWYIHFEVDKRRFKRSLETNVIRSAIERARGYFDDVIEGRWKPAQKRVSKSTVANVIKVYKEKSPVYSKTAGKNVWALKFVLRTCGLSTNLETVNLTELTESLVPQFQKRLVERYVSKAVSESAKREARELALRSSRSLLAQARSMFTKRGHIRDDYAAEGIVVPASIDGFITARRQGRSTKREYHAPDDSVIQATFAEVEGFKESDPDLYKAFWIAVGAGLRRGEIRRLEWSHFVERNGKTWISGGIGKDGEHIEVPIQSKAYAKLSEFRKDKGLFISGGDMPARRLNEWMATHGWNTQKKIHELRAYIGSLIYQVSPVAAMQFMRHKSIRVTEAFYVRYGSAAQPVDVL